MTRQFVRVAAIVAVLVPLAGAVQAQLSPERQFVRDVEKQKTGDAMSYIINGGNANARDYYGKPALVIAAQNEDASFVRFLLENGGDPNIADRETGLTALHVASQLGEVPMAALLVIEGADIDIEDDQGETALIKAVRSGHRRLAKLLFDEGADADLPDYTGNSARDYAVISRDREMRTLFD